MALTSREFQYLCIGCFFVTPVCAIATITSSGTIEINTAADITCINQPYTGTHIWTFNTAEVLICVSSNCMANASNPTRFTFVNDTGSGVFVFTINPVTRLDDESVIGCHDGNVEDTLKLEVKDSDGNQRKKSYGLIIGLPVSVFVVIFGGLCCCCCCPHIVRKLKKSEWQVKRLSSTKLTATLLLRPCHCRTYFFLQYRRKPFQSDNDSTWNVQKFKNNESQAQLDPNADYEVKVCIKLFCIELSRTDICTVMSGKLDPPKNFQFNENIDNDGMPYVSWEPGFNGGCDQTFFLQFEKILIKTHNQTHTARENNHDKENTNTTAAERNKLKFVESHSEILDVESDNMFAIPSHNVTTTIRRQIKGLELSSQYEIKLYGKHEYRESGVKTLHVKTHDKPDPPKDFMFNENISSYELSYVSWVPGFDGGCPQTFILQFETPNQTNTGRGKPTAYKENFHDQEITNTTAAEINKLKIDEGHAEILDVESNNIFAITSNNVKTTIRMQVKGLEPSSQYEIKLYGENKYGKTEVKTLHEKTHDKPNPPEKFKFNQNKSNVSWVPGYDGGCYQTFILQFEKQPPKTEIKTLYQAKEITNTTAAELNKPKIVEGHSEILDVESDKKFVIPSHNVTTTIRMQIKGLEPSSLYEIKLYGKNKYGKSEVKTLHAKTHGKPDPPKKFEFYENINNDEKPYVSWEPGLNGGCDQTFILRFEKILNKTHNQADTARDKPMPIEFVEGHFKILNVESNHIFSITSHKETEEILLLIKGREPSSTYKIMLYSENAYGQSKEMTLYADAADGSSLSYRHTNQPKHDKTLQRHGLSV